MKFRLTFTGFEGHAVETPSGNGLDLLDRARAAMPDAQIDDVKHDTHDHDVSTDLTEAEARACGDWFRQQRDVTITVPDGSLTRYAVVDHDVVDGLCGVRYIITDDSVWCIVADWQAAGCPAHWNPCAVPESEEAQAVDDTDLYRSSLGVISDLIDLAGKDIWIGRVPKFPDQTAAWILDVRDGLAESLETGAVGHISKANVRLTTKILLDKLDEASAPRTPADLRLRSYDLVLRLSGLAVPSKP